MVCLKFVSKIKNNRTYENLVKGRYIAYLINKLSKIKDFWKGYSYLGVFQIFKFTFLYYVWKCVNSAMKMVWILRFYINVW